MKSQSLIITQSKDYYGLKLLFILVIMLLGLTYAGFYLTQNYMSNSMLFQGTSKGKIYFLDSDTLYKMYQKNSMDYEGYKKRIKYLQKLSAQEGYTPQNIYAKDLGNIPKNSILIALDMMSLSNEEMQNIDTFVNKGGKILFNFTSGFLDADLHYQKKNLVTILTPLTINPKHNTINFTKNALGYLTVRLLSPFAKSLPNGRGYDLTVYDPLPLFITPKTLRADAYLTNWSQTSYIIINHQELSKEESGLLWHGGKGKGKWIYFNFPSYLFLDTNAKVFATLFKQMLQHLDENIHIQVYPYLDSKNVVFVSEDTEYKFESLEHFSALSKKEKFPVTAFCVAQLAKKNPQVIQKTLPNKYLEIGSHSYSHKQIVGTDDATYKKETIGSKKLLEKLTHRTVLGFRPPREEIDEKLLGMLEKGGFKYILNKNENSEGESVLKPYFLNDTLIIPRHGTDDYSYLVNLDWNASQILSQIERESQMLTALNGIYTLSVHTHLMSYGSNIRIEENFYKFVHAHPAMKPMNGAMIAKRMELLKKFSYSYKITPKKVLLTLSNNSLEDIKNLKLKIEIAPGIRIHNIESELIGFQTEIKKESDGIYTLTIKDIKPKSKILIFINYEKN